MEAIFIAVVTGVISSVATVAAIKVDVGWIKQTQRDFKSRLSELEDRVLDLEKRSPQ